MNANPHVVSIVSMGHSGSTLLDALCGTIESVKSTGEIIYLPSILERYNRVGDKKKVTYCSCGNTLV